MAYHFPFNLCSPLTGRMWKIPHTCASPGDPGAFGQGSYGIHTGIHIPFSTKQSPIFAPCDGHLVIKKYGILLFRLQLNWPHQTQPQIWSLLAGSVEWSERNHFHTGDILGFGEGELHWEIFLSQTPEKALSNPLDPWNHAMTWSFSNFPYLQGENEFAGPTHRQQTLFEEYCDQHQLETSSYKKAFDDYFSSQNIWKQAQNSDPELPNANQCFHVHPWRFLEHLQAQGSLFPTYRNRKYPDDNDWHHFCGFIKEVIHEVDSLQIFSDHEGILRVGRALLTRIGMQDWQSDPHWNAKWEDISSDIPKLSNSAKSLLLLWIRFRIEEPCYVLYCRKGQNPSDQNWNLMHLVHGSKKKDSEYPLPKSSHLLDFYATPLHDTSYSLFAPSLRWHFSPLCISQGLSYAFSVNIFCSQNIPWNQNLTWKISHDHAIQYQITTTTTTIQVLFFKPISSTTIHLSCELKHLGLSQIISRTIPVESHKSASISFLQSKILIGKSSFALSPLEVSQLPLGRYSQIQDFSYQYSQKSHTLSFTCDWVNNTSFSHTYLKISNEALQTIRHQSIPWIDVVQEAPSSQNLLPSEPLARLRALGYWCESQSSHPIRTFQAEWGLRNTGILDKDTLQCLTKAQNRPGLLVHATTYRKNKKSGQFSARFYQLPAPKHQEYHRYGDLIATPKYARNKELLGVEHNEIWARKYMIEAIQELCDQWWNRSGETMQIGDLSLWCGGLMREHQSHQKGTSMDCRSYTVGAYSLFGKTNAKYSATNTIEFCKIAHRLGFGPIYTSCKKVLRRIGPESSHPIASYQPHHQHHLHLEHRG